MRYLRLDLADNCNLRCIMCQAYNSLSKSSLNALDFDTFARQTKGELQKWSHIQLGNQAEATIHPHFGDFLKFIRAESNAVIHIVTNGRLLDRYAAQINEAGNCLVQISMDSVTRETHEYIRAGSDFEKAIANISRLDTSRTQVLLSFTLMKSNIDEYDEMVRFCREHNYRMAAFPMFVREEKSIIPLNLLQESLWFSMAKLKQWLKQYYGKDYDRMIVGSAPGITNTAVTEFTCTAHVDDLSMDAHGNATLCSKVNLGSLYKRSLLEIWESTEANDFRRQVDENRAPCMTCDYRQRCLAPSMSRLENHFSETIFNAISEPTRRAIGYDREISDEEAVDLFVRDAGAQFGIFDIEREGKQFKARRVARNEGGPAGHGPKLIANSRHELHALMCEATGSPLECRLLETCGSYNIVSYLGKYWALPLTLGHVNLTLESERARPGILASTDLGQLKNRCVAEPNTLLMDDAMEAPAPSGRSSFSAGADSTEAARLLFGHVFNGADIHDATRHRASFHAAIQDEVIDPQWARNLTSLIDGFNHAEINELASMLEHAEDPDRIESVLVHLQVKRIRQQIGPAKKTVAIYFPTAAYREQLGAIPDLLRERGHNVITIVGVICGDKCEQQPNVFYGGHCGQTEIVNQLDFVDLFITPVLATGLPEQARKAYVLHDIHDSPLGDEPTTRGISEKLREFDFVFTPSEPSAGLFRHVVPLARQPDDKPITLIKAGYPKLDRLTRYFEQHRQDAPKLIYAPTVFGYGFDEIVSVVSHGDAIIDSILRRIPDHKLIFRPHPHTLKTDVVQTLAAKYREHPNFVFDDNASSYMENYSQAALMISDISGTAFTYAFATLRPVVFFSPNEEIVRQKYAGLCYAADRSRIGCVVTDVIELVDKINLLLRWREKYGEAVRLCRDQTIFNVNRSEAAFVEHLECVLENRRGSDWVELRYKAA